MENVTLARALQAKEFVLLEIERTEHFGGSKHDDYKTEVSLLEDYVKQTIRFPEKHVVYAKNILSKTVPKEIAEKCFFVNGNYCGLILQDENGQIYSSYEEMMSKLGGNVDFLTNENTWYNKVVCDYEYVEDLELLVCYCYKAMYNQATDSIDVGDKEYIFMTKAGDLFNQNFGYYQYGIYEYFCGESDTLMPAIKKMFKLNTSVVSLSGNKYVALDTMSNVNNAIKHINSAKKKSGKLQNKIDDLIEKYPMKKVSFDENFLYNTLMSKVVIEKLEDNLCVVRWVYCYNDEIFDGMRVYVTDKETYCCKRNNNGEYVRMALSVLNPKNFESDVTTKIEVNDLRGTRLQYSADIIKTIEPEYQVVVLLMCLADERIEQLFKNGFKDAVLSVVKVPKMSLKTELKYVVKVNDNAKTFHGWLGLSKYQLKEIINVHKKMTAKNKNRMLETSLFEMIGDMKMMLSGNKKSDISSVDQETFDKILTIESKIMERRSSFYSWKPTLFAELYNIIYDNFDDEKNNVSNAFIQYIPVLFSMNETSTLTIFGRYRDYLQMLRYVEVRRAFKLFPRNQKEIYELHDQVMPLYQINVDQVTRKEFVENLKKIEKLEYRDNDEYVVKIPTKPDDLAEEGVILSHCVKSYIEKVAKGKTNIVFIRKKTEEDMPFFTVEVDNDKNVVQVHGFANCNVSAVEGLREFVEEWAKNKHLKVGHIDQIR